MVSSYLCTDSPVQKAFTGSYDECTAAIDKTFDKCAHDVENVKLPAILPTRQAGEKHGGILTECAAAYYFGGEHLELFNQAQAFFAE